MTLEVLGADCGYGNNTVVRNISVQVESGEILCILGPNGVGKTTLFKTILGFLKLKGGKIVLNGENVLNWTRKKLAQTVGYVPQAHIPPFPFKVIEVVTMGRTAHLGNFSSPSGRDVEIAENALETLGIHFLRDRIYTEISGGERQMVLIARALTQQPEFLVMDEPTSNLDFGNQVRVLQNIKKLAESGMGVIMTSHFPDHAFLCSGKVALIQKNNKFIVGKAEEVITEGNLQEAYGVGVKIISTTDSTGGTVKTCVPVLEGGFL